MKKGLLQMLEEFSKQDVLAMHMPGHKRKTEKFPYLAELAGALDITEIEGFDNLHDAHGAIKDICDRASALWQSKRTFLSVNGSTGALFAALSCCTKPNDKILVARNAHKSLCNAIELLRLQATWRYPSTEKDFGICLHVDVSDVEKAFQSEKYRAVVLTSPTYEGVISDVESISRIAHANGAVVIVDGAHGAHLDLSPCFPPSGTINNADLAVCGLHKTLPALTQTAVLHLYGEKIPAEDVARAMSVFVTSSPSYILMSSVDGMTKYLQTEGKQAFEEFCFHLNNFRHQAQRFRHLKLYNGQNAFAYDFSKIYVDCSHTDKSGFQIKAILRKRYAIEAEYASAKGVLFIATLADGKKEFDRLLHALNQIDKQCNASQSPFVGDCPPCECVCLPWELSPNTQILPFGEAVGTTCAQTVWVYPPAVPLLLKGERISRQCADFVAETLRCGGTVSADGDIAQGFVKVVAD